MLKRFLYLILMGFFLWPLSAKAAGKLNIQVSIKPIHSIAAFICQGVLEPGLLMKGQESPHTQSLTPQQLQALQQADLMIWTGPEYESHWQNSLQQQVDSKKTVTLSQSPGLTLYPYRCQGLSHNHDHEGHSHSLTDGHIWLDPDNAKVIAQTIAQVIIQLDPSNKAIYEKNLSEFLVQLTALESDLKLLLAPIQGREYLIYHDGLQYFDKYFGVKMAASLVAEPDSPPNAQDFLRLKAWLTTTSPEQRPGCVFTEPGFDPDLAKNLATTFGLKYESVDYIGYGTSDGPGAYFVMMRQLAADLLKGLS
ncbi:zinc ABC transporter substrate-binding protein [Candidatus Finniella inopinata]|nr:zinc ABC transporter substrate-binding protein [Candidatus Finniella inopinata]